MKKLLRRYQAIKKIINYKFFKSYANSLLQLLHWANQKHINIIEKKLGINSINNPSNYESLIPSENADKNNKYSEALKVALQMPKVNNIAVSGPYGSGKSSFLRTFEKNNNEWIYLPISLATFKDDELLEQPIFNNANTNDSTIIVNKDDKNKDTKYEINQIIEKSILQQIFYREEERSIPSSRFKRIKNIKSYWLGLHVGFFILLAILGLFLYAPTYIKKLFLITELPNLNEMALLLSFFIGSGYFIYQLSKYLMNLQVSKLNLKDGEIELGNKEKTSILNEHLDEILYFFEVTRYTVVVLEDLDRFGNTEIFIKLRELNTLINNSKEINRRVVFIYAIKDEMFKDKDRTKFFDFILPIIPYINPSNSLEKIKVKFKEETTIDQDFLSDIALYIDDMRLLVNIYNEYMIYKHKLTSDKLDKNKLLAMIIYKNLYPSDFAKLHFNDGVVSSLFNNKADLIQKQIAKKRTSIGDIEIKIKNIKNENIENITELKMIYLYKLAEKLNATYYKINDAGEYQTLASLKDDPLFDILISSKIHAYIQEYNRSYGRYDYNDKGTIEFLDLESEINEEYSYLERKQFIEDRKNDKIEILQENIEKLENEIDMIKSFTLQKLIQNTSEDIFGQDFADKDILKLFIRDGYLDENYHDYISYFFEGSITLNDREFLLSVKNNRSLEYTYRLSNIEELIKRLKKQDFDADAIFNFDLMAFILENQKNYQDQFKRFVSKLSDESELSIQFLFDYIQHADNLHRGKLVPFLWKKFWWYIIKKSDFSDKKKDEYFDFMFQNLEVEKLIEFNIDNTVKDYIENKDQLIKTDLIRNEKYEKLLKALTIKYRCIDDINNNYTLFNYIYESNHYQINIDMVNKVAFVKGAPESEIAEKLKIAHFTTLKGLVAVKKLIDYIDENIDKYVENVFLKIERNTQESEEILIELLNHKNISFENKVAIIQKEETKISDIRKVINNTWVNLLNANKIVANWSNLLNYYNEVKELDDAMVSFLNEKENYLELAKSSIAKEEIFDKTLLQEVSKKIVVAKNINDDAYSYLVKSTFWRWPNVEIEGMSDKRINIVLENKKLSLSQVNINNLKEYFPNKLIILIENFKAEFLEKIDEFTLDDGDYLQIIRSSEFIIDEKIFVLEKIDLVLFDNEQLVQIAIDIYEHSPKEMAIELFDKLFDKASYDDSLRILTVQIPYLENEKINECLNWFESPYLDLIKKAAKPLKLEITQRNNLLVSSLKEKGLISSFSVGEEKIKVNRFHK